MSVSDGKVRCDVSCLLEKFFGSSCFDPCSEADDGFGVFAKPVGGVAFDKESKRRKQKGTFYLFEKAKGRKQKESKRRHSTYLIPLVFRVAEERTQGRAVRRRQKGVRSLLIEAVLC